MDNISSNLPPPIQITKIEKYSETKDPPMVDLKVTNPVSYFKKWIEKFLKNQDIDLRLKIKPFATIGLIFAFTAVGGTFFTIGRYLFPNSSPILHRAITLQGTLQKSAAGQPYLTLADNSLWTVKLRPPVTAETIKNLVGQSILVKGNLNKDAFVIEVSEIIPLQIPTAVIPETSPDIQTADNDTELPDLYPNLSWEKAQKKVLIFTSGKRKIEQEGIYLESSQRTDFPQEFINYYVAQLTGRGFKETLNSIDSDGIVITYAQGNVFLTFGIKNIYSGSGDKKKLAGYKAFIEHN